MKNWKDILGGGFFVVLGSYVLITAHSFGLGSSERMGGGYYPMILGATSIALGIFIGVIGWREKGRTSAFNLLPLVAVFAGLSCFVLLIDRAGIIPAVFVLIVVASLAENEKNWVSTAWLAFVFSVVSWLLFSVILELPVVGVRGLI
jgi:hypothetical protein